MHQFLDNTHGFLVALAAFIVLIGLMVIVHEFGHFAVAKLCKVRVEAFSFGFGPRLFGVKYGDTDYKVCLLPLGGFVKMTGESPEQNLEAPGTETPPPIDDPGAFTAHPRWQRMLIGLAGPVANFVLAFVLMVIYFGWLNEVPVYQVHTTTVEWVIPGSAAAQAGIQTGDVIRRFDSKRNPDWDDVRNQIDLNVNQTVPVTVERNGQLISSNFHIPTVVKNEDYPFSETGLLPQILSGPIHAQEVQSGMPADQAGLRAGDDIQSVDGLHFHYVVNLLDYMQEGKGKPLTLVVLRNGATVTLIASPAKLDSGWKLGFVPTPPPMRKDPLPINRAASRSLAFCVDKSTLIFETLQHLLSHKVSVTQLAGPVGIARVAGEAAQSKSWAEGLGLAGIISLNLGILNLLPFPILDGGMILFLLIEGVIRRDINMAVKERIYQAAFVLLIAFFVFTVFNDLSKFPIFSHVKP